MMPEPDIRVIEDTASPDATSLRVDRPVTLVIFGATGDLTARKLVPALFNLHRAGFLTDRYTILGVARRQIGNDGFREAMEKAIEKFSRAQPRSDAAWDTFASRLKYHALQFDDISGYDGLREAIEREEQSRNAPGERLFYLAVDPGFFDTILNGMTSAGLVRDVCDAQCSRVIIEKPFGHDLESAKELNTRIRNVLSEDQTLRIDHYLGKDTVQNIMALRFGNAIFDPLFNNKYVDHVQITMAETVGMEGRRGPFYDTVGALRDVMQNHLLQLLTLVTMEPPAFLTPKAIRDEKVKILNSLRPYRVEEIADDVVRGQYAAGKIGGEAVPGYREEEGVDSQSSTETFVALRLGIDSWRWSGVPFVLRTGKRMPRRTTEIAVQFKQPPMHYFTNVECIGDVCDLTQAKPNMLVFRVQPNEGVNLTFSAKRPGMLMQTHAVDMDFVFNETFSIAMPEAYERLLLDAMRGDSTLFMREDEVEAAWRFVDPILKAWSGGNAPPLHTYAAGEWGPREANALLQGCHGSWRNA